MKKGYEIVTLDNGLRVVAVPMKERYSTAIGIWAHVGGRHEEPRLSGVSHFLEHIVFKGTKTRTANQIKESIEGVGGSMNAFTGEEYTCFLAKVARRHFENVYDVLADMVLNASMKESDIEKERTVIMEEVKMTQDQPSQLADELLSEIVWPNHPLGRPIAGTLETVGGLTRQDIADYRDKNYTPDMLTVVAAGDIDQATLIRETKRHFGHMPPGHQKKDEDLFRSVQTKPGLKLYEKSTEQTHLALAFHGLPKDHVDEFALDVMNVIMGGNMSSRLFNEVREERGLAYDVGSYVRRYHETGAFVVSAGVDNKKPAEAIRVILKELKKITVAPVSADELRRAKDFYLGQLELGLENSMNQMLWAGENAVTLNRCRSTEEILDRVEKVTVGDIQKVAKFLFKDETLNMALVGPKQSETEFAALLTLQA